MTVDAQAVAERLAVVRARLQAVGRDDIRILAVTKGFDRSALQVAEALGLPDVGENYAQELLGKIVLPRPVEQTMHFIGRLQTNKVGSLKDAVDVWQSVDRASVVNALSMRVPGAHIFVQVNVSEEPQKGGCAPHDTEALVVSAQQAGLIVRGLMTVGKAGPPIESAAGFRWLRRTADRLGLTECSMGMSDDLEIAAGEGSTMVRVGSALFGDRPRIAVRNN